MPQETELLRIISQLSQALTDLVEAIRNGEDVTRSHWAYLRAEALLPPQS